MTAAVYASRAGLNTCLIDKGPLGGQVATTFDIENWPGEKSIKGAELAKKFAEHARAFGAEIMEFTEVQSADLPSRKIRTQKGEISAKAVIIATGARERKLGVPGESELKGRGVSYCATCDAPFFQGRHVAVVGGGNSALDEGHYLTRFASKVTLIHRRAEFRAEKAIQERARSNPKMEFLLDTEVVSVNGKAKVEGLTIRNKKTGKTSELKVDGVFFYVGLLPNTEAVSGPLKKDEQGHIITNERMETGIPFVYAAGDVRSTPARQITVAAADGTIAAIMAERALSAALEKKD